MDSMERELAGQQQRVKALEGDLKLREQHLLAFEQDIKECPYCNVKFELQGVRELMDELRGFGIDMSSLDGKYHTAMDHMKKEAYDSALDSTRTLLRELRTVREDILAKGIRYLVSASARTVASARENGLDTAEAERLLAQARAAVDKEEFRAAEHLAKEAEYIARDLLKQDSSSVQLRGAIEPDAGPVPSGEQEPKQEQQPEPAPEDGSYPSMYPPPEEPQQYESNYPPPQEEAPAQEQAPQQEPTDRIYNCSSCFAAFKIGSSQRPVRVSCRSCGNSMIISD
jgi:DNA-directed RNA polymerase subunit RPC12/RpoP